MPWETNHKPDRRPGSNPHMLEREAERAAFSLESAGLYEQPGLEIAERDRHRQASSPRACATYRTSTG